MCVLIRFGRRWAGIHSCLAFWMDGCVRHTALISELIRSLVIHAEPPERSEWRAPTNADVRSHRTCRCDIVSWLAQRITHNTPAQPAILCGRTCERYSILAGYCDTVVLRLPNTAAMLSEQARARWRVLSLRGIDAKRQKPANMIRRNVGSGLTVVARSRC